MTIDPFSDPFSQPAGVEARLPLAGYIVQTEIVLATEREIGGQAAKAEIVAIDDETGWKSFRQLTEDPGSWGPVTAAEAYSPVRRRGDAFTWFLAIEDRKAVGYFSARTKGGLGYLEDLFVHPAYRLRGIATALVHRAAACARAKGAATFLPASADDTPKEMYARMGFEPLFVFRNYFKRIEGFTANR